MNIAFYFAHPAHYHYFKHTAKQLAGNGHHVSFIIREKDILRQLLDQDGQEYCIIGGRRGNGWRNMVGALISTEYRMVRYLRKHNIDVLVGCPFSFATRCCTNTKIISTGEDDAAVVPLYAKIVYPFTHIILSPVSCDNGKWNKKTIHYPGFMKLAYLHPHQFTPSRDILHANGIDDSKPYFLLRFASLHAHHDKGIGGFSTEVAQRVIDMLRPHGNIYITAERPLEPEFEQYRLNIKPTDIHHVMAFASIYMGDSQSMAVEAAMLGVPAIRFNDFAGKIGVLEELEHTYQLTFGIPTSQPERLYQLVQKLIDTQNLHAEFQQRRARMLAEKIDVTAFWTWFIENYPESAIIMRKDPDYQLRFK